MSSATSVASVDPSPPGSIAAGKSTIALDPASWMPEAPGRYTQDHDVTRPMPAMSDSGVSGSEVAHPQALAPLAGRGGEGPSSDVGSTPTERRIQAEASR